MLADALGVPAWTKGSLRWGSCVMQAHWLAPRGRCRTVALFRDGRDVMVSYYHHYFFRNEFQNEPLTRFMRERFDFDDYEDVPGNLLPFVREMIDDPVTPGFSWVDFVRAWAQRPGVVRCHYEDLRRDVPGELMRLVRELAGRELGSDVTVEIAERNAMRNMRERKAELQPGMTGRQSAEISFIRKGAVGGWSEHVSDEALQWFEARAGDALDLLGYARGRPSAVGER